MCWPDAYGHLSQEHLRTSIRHFIFTFLWLFLILAVLFIPAFFLSVPGMEARFAQFDTFELNGSFEAGEPILLLETPHIIYDENASDASGAQIVFGQDEIYYKAFYWFGQRAIDYDTLRDPSDLDSRLVFFLALFIWPALIFWSGLYVLIKMLLIIVLFALFGWAFVMMLNHTIPLRRSFKVALYAAVPALTVEMILLPFWYNGWLPFIIYLVFYAVGLALVSQRRHKHKF